MLTSTPNTTAESEYPTDWHMIDDIAKVQCRQVSHDTYQLRTYTHVMTINKEGFDLYRADDQAFDEWCTKNKIVAIPRPTEDEI